MFDLCLTRVPLFRQYLRCCYIEDFYKFDKKNGKKDTRKSKFQFNAANRKNDRKTFEEDFVIRIEGGMCKHIMVLKGTLLSVFPRFFCLGDDFLSLLICHYPFLLW